MIGVLECRTQTVDPFTLLLYEFLKGEPLPTPSFSLINPGTLGPIDYATYGRFEGVGTPQYRYIAENPEGLRQAIGEGIFPNQEAVLQNPAYLALAEAGKLSDSHWDALRSENGQAAFFIWALAGEDPGVQTYFTGVLLEQAGHITHALKAYYAAFIHFPQSVGWGENQNFVWYIAPAALASIHRLCRDYPALGVQLVDAKVVVENSQDINLENDVITVWPGRFVRGDNQALFPLADLDELPVRQVRGKGQVQLVQLANGHWQLRVNNKPFLVRGVTYSPTMIGIGPNNDRKFSSHWMFSDQNQNGKIDAPYEAWVDRNANGTQEADEPAVGDFQLMKDAGINTLRLYAGRLESDGSYDPSSINKPLLRDLYERYQIRVIMGDFLGAYTIGSGATWEAGTDYTNPEQRRRLLEGVRQMVEELRSEPFILMWLLGNENNMVPDYTGVNATRTNAGSQPQAYASLLQEVSQMIHALDPDHPVAIGNLDTGMLDVYAQHAQELDIIGINAYRGQGFGGLWEEVKQLFDRPVLITEYGCDAFFEGKGEDEDSQAAYHNAAVRDIVFNQAGGPFTGNAVGGVIFEYLDEWWKDTHSGDPENRHQTLAQYSLPFPDGKSHEEWFGMASQGSGAHSPFERRLRKVYYQYQNLWNKTPLN